MRRSTRNFNIPSPSKPRAFDYSLCPGSGEIDHCFGRVGESELKLEGLKCFFFLARVAITAINTYFDETEDSKGRDIANS